MKLYFGGLVRTDIAVLSAPKVSPVELPFAHSACRFFGQPNAPASQPGLYFKLISVLVGRNLFSKLQLDNRTGQNGPLSCSEVVNAKNSQVSIILSRWILVSECGTRGFTNT